MLNEYQHTSAASQSYGFSRCHVCMWEVDHKERWTLKNRCFQTVVLEKTLESPLDSKEIQLVILKEINPEYSLKGLMLTEALILWPPDAKSRLTGKNPDAGKDWRQEKKEAIEGEMVRWRRWLNRMTLSKLWEMLRDREAWHAAVYGVTKSRTLLSDWTEHIFIYS